LKEVSLSAAITISKNDTVFTIDSNGKTCFLLEFEFNLMP